LQLRIGLLEKQTKDEARAVGTKSTLNGKEVEWTGSTWKPTKAPAPGAKAAAEVPKAVEETSQSTKDLDKKAASQIKETTAVKTGTEKTTQAVKELTAKITPQTNLQTSVAAIYNLLASGMLRVQTNVRTILGGGSTDPRGFTDNELPFKPGANPNSLFINPGAWDTKISTNSLGSNASQFMTGGEVAVNAPITINQQPGQDADELASLVAVKIGEAVADARAASIFV
jgi:hypothetical protein